ncbi:MAG TPA: dienelactone hydrolase family protein [Blastocatellia bacterium]|nr:dienelactone hydrolase family protein [Blastocatellia bacterium]
MANQSKTVEFEAGAKAARGYLVGAGDGGKRPGLLAIHEWWGLNDHIKDVANRFAAEGYTVLAPDLYDGTITRDPEEAGRLMQGLDQGRALAILDGAVDYLKRDESVDAGKIAATGFCMGGSYALLLATHNRDIKAVAPFYGDVPGDEELKNLGAPVLFIGAEHDNWITLDKMKRLESALGKYGKEGEVKVYPGVGHAFFNDTRPDAYDEGAARDAWRSVTEFFRERLG